MAGVIIVSNRLPVSVKKENGQLSFTASLGGIATGLGSYVSGRSGNLWIGWPGIASELLTQADKQTITSELSRQGYLPVFLSRRQIDYFYNGYSNSVLWPLFHSLPLKASPDEIKSWWQAYESVNQRYSETILNMGSQGSQIWIHDYQLLLVAGQLRRESPAASIGLFVHIPFPSPRQLAKLEHRDQLLHGMIGADLIGFHTVPYVDNFLKNVSRLGLPVNNKIITDQARQIRVAEFPMGIDYERYNKASKLAAVKSAVKSYRQKYGRVKLIVSIDRLDPSKGLVERLKAYQQFLSQNPGQIGRVILVMVAAPSRTDIEAYKQLAERLTKLAKQINQQFGTDDWQPVDYINRSVPFEEVTALFQLADVAFITPLKDGMNLAAKEFVASNRQKGVLILSSTAGAAAELTDALVVNSKQPESLVAALTEALTMRRRELRRRLKRMRSHLSSHTVQHWAKSFIDSLNQPLPGTPHLTRSLGARGQAQLVQAFAQAKKRLLLLDYDGSLVPFSENYMSAVPPESLLELIKDLVKDRRNEVVVISGRAPKQMEAWFGDLPISLVAEHGAASRIKRGKWQFSQAVDSDWQQLVLPSLEQYAALTPGARVEIKPNSLVWHYRAASPYFAQKYSVIIRRSLKPFLKRNGLSLVQGNKIMEIKRPNITKGEAAKHWLSQGYDFVLAIGDDATDEELFTSLPPDAYSIKVGRGLTKARFRLSSQKTVLRLLARLSTT